MFCECALFTWVLNCFFFRLEIPSLVSLLLGFYTLVSLGRQKWLLICIFLRPHIKLTHQPKQFNFPLSKLWVKIFYCFDFFHNFIQCYCSQNQSIFSWNRQKRHQTKSKNIVLTSPILLTTWLLDKYSCLGKFISNPTLARPNRRLLKIAIFSNNTTNFDIL